MFSGRCFMLLKIGGITYQPNMKIKEKLPHSTLDGRCAEKQRVRLGISVVGSRMMSHGKTSYITIVYTTLDK